MRLSPALQSEPLTHCILLVNGKKFNVNSCKVVIGTDTYELDKKNKSYQFFKDNGSWCVTEQSIKVVV